MRGLLSIAELKLAIDKDQLNNFKYISFLVSITRYYLKYYSKIFQNSQKYTNNARISAV